MICRTLTLKRNNRIINREPSKALFSYLNKGVDAFISDPLWVYFLCLKIIRGGIIVNKFEFIYRTAAALFGGIIGYLFGGWSTLISILVTFIIIDYISGILAAGYLGKLSSSVGFKGIAKKVMIIIVVAAAHLADQAMGTEHIARDAVIFFYLANELLSILENAGKTGLPVPDQITRLVEILKGGKK
jgi:toxin secretion/phage lysis holin